MQWPVLALILLDVPGWCHLTSFDTLASMLPPSPSFLPTSLVAPFPFFFFPGFPSILMSWCWHARGLSFQSSSLPAVGSLRMSSSLMVLNTTYTLRSTSICSPDLSSKLQLRWTSHFTSLLVCPKDFSNSCPKLNPQFPFHYPVSSVASSSQLMTILSFQLLMPFILRHLSHLYFFLSHIVVAI